MPHGEQLTAAGSDGISKGVLVTISIPIFTAQLEKSREATDQANIRDAYAVCQTSLLTNDNQATVDKNKTEKITYAVTQGTDGVTTQIVVTVNAVQTQANWQSANDAANIEVGGLNAPAKTTGTAWTITVKSDNSAPTIG